MSEPLTLVFDPEGSVNFPNKTEVEILLGGVPVAIFDDGTEQFMDDYEDPIYEYSPRLTPDELERFCEENMDKYVAFHHKHERQLLRCERIPMEKFW